MHAGDDLIERCIVHGGRTRTRVPSTAELLVWLAVLSARDARTEDVAGRPWPDVPGLRALIKDTHDLRTLGCLR